MSTQYPDSYDPDLSRLAIQYLMDEKGVSKKRMAEKLNEERRYTTSISQGNISTYLRTGTGLSEENVFHAARALGAQGWSELYAEGDRAAKENPFNPEWVRDSFKILMKEENLSTTQLAKQTNNQRKHLETFLNTGEYMAISYLLDNAKGLGATGWGDLYRKAGVPERSAQQDDHDIAVSGIVQSLKNITSTQKVGEVMDKPIIKILEEREHQGHVQDKGKEQQL